MSVGRSVGRNAERRETGTEGEDPGTPGTRRPENGKGNVDPAYSETK